MELRTQEEKCGLDFRLVLSAICVSPASLEDSLQRRAHDITNAIYTNREEYHVPNWSS